MSPTLPSQTVPNLVAAVRKEIRRMSRNLVRFLDRLSHVTVVFLALYVGAATLGIGV